MHRESINAMESKEIFLTTRELANALGCNIETIRRHIRNGKLNAKRTGKNQGYLVSVTDVKEMLNNYYRLRGCGCGCSCSKKAKKDLH